MIGCGIKPLRVVHVCSWMTIGGVQRVVAEISRGLATRGHRVHVFHAGEERFDLNAVPGVNTFRVSNLVTVSNTPISLTLPFRLFRERFDIMHAHFPMPWAADWAVWVAKIKRRPVVLTYHNDISGRGLNGLLAGLYNQSVLRLTLALADTIVVHRGRFVFPTLRRYADKVVIFPLGADLQRLRLGLGTRDPYRIFFLAVLDRFRLYKGLEVLLNAFVSVIRDVPEARLVIGGTGELEPHYKALCAQLGVANSVQFLGYVPDETVCEEFCRSQVFVLPSTDSSLEGFGLVAIEALACGVPVITTPTVGVAEDIISANAGLVVPERDPAALAQAIITLLKDPARASEMGAAGRRLAEKKYSWTGVAEHVEQLYQQLVKTDQD